MRKIANREEEREGDGRRWVGLIGWWFVCSVGIQKFLETGQEDGGRQIYLKVQSPKSRVQVKVKVESSREGEVRMGWSESEQRAEVTERI